MYILNRQWLTWSIYTNCERGSIPRQRLLIYKWVAPLWLVFMFHIGHCLIVLIYIYKYILYCSLVFLIIFMRCITDKDASRNVLRVEDFFFVGLRIKIHRHTLEKNRRSLLSR